MDTVIAQMTPTPETQPSLEEQIEALRKQGAYPGEEGGPEATSGDTPDVETGEATEEVSERPEWLPEGFNTPEELAKAYEELAAKGEDTNEAEEAAEEAVAKAGLDMSALESEYAEKGELSAKSLKALEAVGITKDVVDTYIKGQEAMIQVYESSVMSAVGGQEAYEAMIKWAGTNLEAEEIEAFDEAVNSLDMKKAKFAVSSLKARYEAAYGKAPGKTLDGKGSSSEGGYQSTAEMERDMNDTRYRTDPAFRAKVQARIAASQVI